MGIAFDAAVDGGIVNPGTSLTWSHTCTGSNLVLWVGVFGDTVAGDATGNNISGAAYAGTTMTEAGRVATPGDRWAYLFYKIAPAVGANNVVVSAGASIAIAGQSASYAGVRQSGVPDVFTTNTDPAALSIVTSLNVIADQSWVILFSKNGHGTPIAGAATSLVVASANGEGFFDNEIAGPIGAGVNELLTINSGGFTATWGTLMASFAPVSTASMGYLKPNHMHPRLFRPGNAR